MLKRCFLPLLVAVFVVGLSGVSQARNKLLSQIRLDAHDGSEKKAGVWVDGQYWGYVKELKGRKKILLTPGRHSIVVKQAWYQDFVREVMLDPGKVYTIDLRMEKLGRPHAPKDAAQLQIYAWPERAAVFVDGQFAGHVDEFNGVVEGLLLTPGRHDVRVELIGYQPFATVVDLKPYQKLKIETRLMKGNYSEAGALVNQRTGGQ